MNCKSCGKIEKFDQANTAIIVRIMGFWIYYVEVMKTPTNIFR